MAASTERAASVRLFQVMISFARRSAMRAGIFMRSLTSLTAPSPGTRAGRRVTARCPAMRRRHLGFGGNLVAASAWRGRWMDITGRINLGLRPYRPETGSFESYDPAWNGSDPNGYSFAGGEPILGFDPDGRLAKQGWED